MFHKLKYFISFKQNILICNQIKFIVYYLMNQLINLTQSVRKWNMMGHSLLPELELVIIDSSNQQALSLELISEMKGTQITIDANKNMNYRLFMLKDDVLGRIHLLLGLQQNQIKDHQFRYRKSLIQKFLKLKDTIFIVFSEESRRMLARSQHNLSLFGYSQNSPRIIFLQTTMKRKINLFQEMLKIYSNLFSYDLVVNFRMMMVAKRQSQVNSLRYKEWKKVLSRELDSTSYFLLSLRSFTNTMISSFSGTYSSSDHFQKLGLGKSIHWKVMELLHGFWEFEGATLQKTVEAFPLSFIEQEYKLSDHYSIGGFLPDTCFKSIFSPPLYRLKDALLSSMENVKQSILWHIEKALNFIFENTSIKSLVIQREVESIQRICSNFQAQLQLSLKSQIQFIHANPEDFWNYRQLNSSFYTPEQQIYIEIKYIGKAYVKRVYQSIKDSVPRLIGQGLLKKIVQHLENQTFNIFTQITKIEEFQIIIPYSQIQKYQTELKKVVQLQNLINFFSLKVSSAYLIKNLHQKKKLQWDRMFATHSSQQVPNQIHQLKREEPKGVMNWVRNIFRGKKKQEIQKTRPSSVEKNQHYIEQEQKKPKKHKKNLIDEKHWLLIINTGKEVSQDKIKFCAEEGFPIRFRSSIWMYLATRSSKQKKVKLSTLLEESKASEETVRQVQKDVLRTPPKSIFQYSLKESLTRILLAYSVYDKQIQYTQGMNFIVAVILLTLTNYGQKSNIYDQKMNLSEIEEKGFTILKFLMEKKGVRKVMLVNGELLADIFVRLEDLITELSPKMKEVMDKSGFGCQMFFSSPIISCLSNTTNNITLLQRFMDLLISYDFLIVYRVIAHFVANSQFLESKMNSETIFDTLRNRIYDEVFNVIGQEGITKIFHSL